MQQTLIFSFFPLLSGRTAPHRPRPLRFHHLPLEIIQLVFEEVVTEFDDDGDRTPTFSDAHTLSFVCRSWRTIVLNTPILWSIVDGHHPPETLDLSLLRAARAPLTLYVSPEHGHPISLDASWKLHRRLHLFASFSSVPYLADWHILQGQLCSAAPRLRAFKLSLGSFGWCNCSLPRNILGGVQPPHLRELALEGMCVDWGHHAYLFRDLRVLTLAPSNRPTQVEFHHILQNATSLQELKLFDALPRTILVNSLEIVDLPCLRVIEIDDDIRACTSFFQNIMASLTTVKLHLQSTTPGEVDGFFQALSTLIHVAPEMPSKRLSISVSDAGLYFGRTFKMDGPLPWLEDPDEEVWLDITLQANRGNDLAVEQCVSSAIKHLPLGCVHELALDVSTMRLSSTFWMDALPSAAPKLYSLKLGKGTMSSFFSAYARFFKTHPVTDAGPRITVPYKRLREVSCDFTAQFPAKIKYVLESSWRAGHAFELVHRVRNYW